MRNKSDKNSRSVRARVGDKNLALEQFRQRYAQTTDEGRAVQLEKRKQKSLSTARENIARLCDPDSFVEYGQFVVAAQRSRRSAEDLIEKTSGDGVLTGIATINREICGERLASATVIANDYSVLAATQGYFHHKKIDRLLALAHANRLPVVMYTEGGGGRPGDTDVLINHAGLEVQTFSHWASLSTIKIAVNRGYCFAGNAVLFGGADFKIATLDSCIGMAGPAMIEGGGLGRYKPEQIGPAQMQAKNGLIDMLVENEEEATDTAKKLLSFFQGSIDSWDVSDQSELWDMLPDDRRFSYDPRKLIALIADKDSFLEYQREFGRALVVGFARIEGRPIAILANDTRNLGGALDCDASVKAAQFVTLCERLNIAILSLCDTPGFMVGPEHEERGAVKASAEFFNAAARVTVPVVCIVIRKAYGLGVMAMAMGDFNKPILTASWPTGEFGGMGLEGAVFLGYKKELDAVSDPEEKQKLFDQLLANLYEKGKAAEIAAFLEIDAVIEPADTRQTILAALSAADEK